MIFNAFGNSPSLVPIALRIDGGFPPQFVGETPDLTGLKFIVIYDLPSSDAVEIVSPSVYTQIGPQEVTFRYVDGELVAETSKEADVDAEFSVVLNKFKVDTTATSITSVISM